MESLYAIQDAVLDRLHEVESEIERKGGLPDGCVELTDKLTHTLKSVVTILAMYEGGYSEDGGYSGNRSYEGGASMDMGGGSSGASMSGYSGRRGRSRTTGRFVSRSDGGYSGRRGRGYSRDEGQQNLMSELEQIAQNTQDNAVRQRLNEIRQRMGGGQ